VSCSWGAATASIFGVEETPETKGWPQMLTIASVREITQTIGTAGQSPLRPLIDFRAGFHRLLWRRADALFELTDAMLCAQGLVCSPVELSMEPEFRRGHGSVYDALDQGRIDTDGLRRLPLSASASSRHGEPLMFALDVTPDARPDAEYADERVMVQVRGKGGDKFLPGWPYSLLVGVQWGSSSWVDPIQARRIGPGEEHTDVTIEQITGLLADLRTTGKLAEGDAPPLMMLDAGNYATEISHALAGQHVQVLVRLRATLFSTPTPNPANREKWEQASVTAASSPVPTPPSDTPRRRTDHRLAPVWHRARARLDRPASKAHPHWPMGRLPRG
jgi:hypothetical protein